MKKQIRRIIGSWIERIGDFMYRYGLNIKIYGLCIYLGKSWKLTVSCKCDKIKK